MWHLRDNFIFPGGIGEFRAPKDDFLVFEKGPSETVVLQWATYADAGIRVVYHASRTGYLPADDILDIMGEDYLENKRLNRQKRCLTKN